MSSKLSKKQNFITEKKGSKKILIISVILVAVFALGIGIFLKKGDSVELYNVGAVNYEGKTIQMTDIKNSVKDGKIIIPLKDVQENSIIYTQYTKNNKTVPLTAFVTPSGDIVAAISICEPCRGTKFHIKGQELVCNACGTRWTLDGLKGTWGGCLKYPPDSLNYEMDQEGINILLDEQEVIAWQPRK